MNFIRLVFSFGICVVISETASSQCLSDSEMWKKIVQIDTISNHSDRLKKINNLKIDKERCNQTTDSVYAKILHIIGKSYWKLKNIEKALLYTKKAIEINTLKSVNASKIQAGLSYYNLAAIQKSDLQDYNSSLINFNKSIILLERHSPQIRFISLAYRLKSSIYFSFGDYQNCIQNAEKAIQKANSDFVLICDAYTEKTQALIEVGDFINAEKDLKFIITQTQKNLPNQIELANLYSNYAYLKAKQKNYNEAIIFNTKALKINQLIQYDYGSAQVLLTIGDLYIQKKEYSKALLFLNHSFKFSEKLNDLAMRTFDNIAFCYAKQHNYSGALLTFQRGLTEYLKNDFTFDSKKNPNSKVILNIGSKEYLILLIQHKAETWLAYYKQTHKKDYLQNALETFAVADKMVDYMRQEHVGYQSKLFWRDKTHALYENAIEVCFLMKNYERGFYFFEKSRAVLLNDKINNLSANQLLQEADQLKERKFQQDISDLNSKIDQETNEEIKSQINVKMLDIQGSQQAFINGLAIKYPSYYKFKYDTSMYSLAQFKQYLRKRNTSFIEYFKGDSANYQLVIKSAGINIIKQKPTENNFQYLMNASDLGERVIISQDGEFVPLDTLKNSKKEYLLNKYAFSYTYSAQYLLRNENNKALESSNYFKNFIGFAPVNYSKSMALPSLMGAEKALDKVSQNYFWPHNFQNEKATKSNFKRNASDYKIIQLFTHADADNISKEPTIFFADSSMKVSELESIGKFKAELLVLSACKTNVGKIIRGEGTLSMAREFAGLGIPASITTLWSVENDATYQITELFYKYLKKGEPKDLALQKAKLEFLETNSREKQNPKYWSAFVLMGEVNPLIIEVNAFYWLVGILALVTILVIIYFIFRSKPVIIK